jgi:hypothetical protein
VIRQDEELTKSLGREMKAMKFHNEESLDAVASLMQDYIDQAKQIDTKLCPRDFAEAYYRNLAAWSDEAEAFRSHPHIQTGDEAFVNGFFRGLQGDVSGGEREIRSEVNEWQRNVDAKQSEIDRTWAEVQHWQYAMARYCSVFAVCSLYAVYWRPWETAGPRLR